MRSRPVEIASNDVKKTGEASETDPLLFSPSLEPDSRRNSTESYHQGNNIRARRSSKSPLGLHFQSPPMDTSHEVEGPSRDNSTYNSTGSHYDMYTEESTANQSQHASLDHTERALEENRGNQNNTQDSSVHRAPLRDGGNSKAGEQPLFEIPEEIYAVRKSALKVLKPLTRTWLVVTVGFSMTALFGMVRWTRLIINFPYWFILLPSWASHVGLFWCHISSARALSRFIAETNDSRQRPNSVDHLDRTEYLPLLQRSLKFGLKTGLLSFVIFVLEVLVYVRLAKGSISVAVTFIPLWFFTVSGLLHGVICKTQHVLKLLCWTLGLTSMVLIVMKLDQGMDQVTWSLIISPIVAVLAISSATLIYIVYGHQIGYYRLTEAQLTAGILYSMAALFSIILLVIVGGVMPLDRPVEIETRIFLVVLAPLIVTLVGMGAWAISRDEFAKLLFYGGQATVHPMKLRLETEGWTSVDSKGIAMIPMFGEVSYKPLQTKNENLKLLCLSFYPHEDAEDETLEYLENGRWENPYIAPSSSQTTDPQE